MYFEHEKRFICYQKYTYGDLSMFLYLDEALKVKEVKDYLHRIETHPGTHNLTDYHKNRNTFGTLALLTSFKKSRRWMCMRCTSQDRPSRCCLTARRMSWRQIIPICRTSRR